MAWADGQMRPSIGYRWLSAAIGPRKPISLPVTITSRTSSGFFCSALGTSFGVRRLLRDGVEGTQLARVEQASPRQRQAVDLLAGHDATRTRAAPIVDTAGVGLRLAAGANRSQRRGVVLVAVRPHLVLEEGVEAAGRPAW
jgi:hypothetical protein